MQPSVPAIDKEKDKDTVEGGETIQITDPSLAMHGKKLVRNISVSQTLITHMSQ